MKATGDASVEYHGSASVARTDATSVRHAVFESPYPLKVTSVEKVQKMRAILNAYEHVPEPDDDKERT